MAVICGSSSLNHSHKRRPRSVLFRRIHTFLFVLLAGSLACFAQPSPKTATRPQKKPNEQDVLQQHYDSARTFQLSGDTDRAAAEYTTFLAGTLRSISRASVALGH